MKTFKKNEYIQQDELNVLGNNTNFFVKNDGGQCKVTEQTPNILGVDFADGVVSFGGIYANITASSISFDAAPTTTDFSRFDLVVVNSSGTVSIIKGTEEETDNIYPNPPLNTPVFNTNDYILLARVFIGANVTEITNADIIDLRCINSSVTDLKEVEHYIENNIINNLEQNLRLLLLEHNASLNTPVLTSFIADFFPDADGYINTVSTSNTTCVFDDVNLYYSNFKFYSDITTFPTPWNIDTATHDIYNMNMYYNNFSQDANAKTFSHLINYEGRFSSTSSSEYESIISFDDLKVFSIDDLPFCLSLISTGFACIVYVKNSGELATTEESIENNTGDYYFDKVDNNTIKWKKNIGGSWANIDVTTWTTSSLELKFTITGSTLNNVSTMERASLYKDFFIGDGTNWENIFTFSAYLEEYNIYANRPQQSYSVLSGFIGQSFDLILETEQLNDSNDTENKTNVSVMFESEIEENAGTIGVQVSTNGGTNWTNNLTTFISSGDFKNTGLINVTEGNEGTDVRVRFNLATGSDLIKNNIIKSYSVSWYPED